MEQHQQEERRRRRHRRWHLRRREREHRLGHQRQTGPERNHPEADPDPVHERVDRDRVGRRLRRGVVRRQHDVDVVAGRSPDRHLGGRLVFVLVEEPPRRQQLADHVAVLAHRDVAGDHLLLGVAGHPQRIVTDGELADLDGLARLQQRLLFLLEPLAREAKEHEHHPDVDDVAAVAPLRAGDQADHRGQDVGAGGALPHERAAHELLADRHGHERAEREADAAGPLAHAERRERRPGDERRHGRPQELMDHVRDRRLAPREQRTDAGQQQQHQADRQHPLVEERRADGQALPVHRLAQRREHRREQDEERGEEQDPVVGEERRLARHPGIELVARAQQRQPVDDEPEADGQNRHHEDGEHQRQLLVFAEGMDRLDDARAGHERAEDRQEERDDHQRDVPHPQHPAPLLDHHRVQERGRREPRQQAGVLDRIPAPEAAPPELLVGPQHPERQAERQEQPADHRPAADRAEPRVVQVPGHERRHAERIRDRHRDEPDVERRRMDRHVEVLEERVEPLPFDRRHRQERRERVVVHDHQEDEEHLRGGNGGDDPGNELAVALAVHVDGDRPEVGEQEHPEHDRAVETAPVRRDLVGQRLRHVRVVLDVLDRVVVRDEGVNQHGGGGGHQRGHQVERPDAAFDQAPRSPPRAGHGGRERIRGNDEAGEEEEGAKCGHGPSSCSRVPPGRPRTSTGTSPSRRPAPR